MSQAPASASGLVRVTVASGSRRVDLVLPGAVPVAELVPELARSVGLLDPVTVHGGYRLVTRAGVRLAVSGGLLEGEGDLRLLDPPRVDRHAVVALAARQPGIDRKSLG